MTESKITVKFDMQDPRDAFLYSALGAASRAYEMLNTPREPVGQEIWILPNDQTAVKVEDFLSEVLPDGFGALEVSGLANAIVDHEEGETLGDDGLHVSWHTEPDGKRHIIVNVTSDGEIHQPIEPDID